MATPAQPESAAATAESEAESALVFPCEFPIKVMGRMAEGFAQQVIAIVVRYAPDFDPASLEMRSSSAGNWLSLTATIHASSRAQLDAIYRELTAHPMVRMAL